LVPAIQATYYAVILRRVGATIVIVEKQ